MGHGSRPRGLARQIVCQGSRLLDEEASAMLTFVFSTRQTRPCQAMSVLAPPAVEDLQIRELAPSFPIASGRGVRAACGSSPERFGHRVVVVVATEPVGGTSPGANRIMSLKPGITLLSMGAESTDAILADCARSAVEAGLHHFFRPSSRGTPALSHCPNNSLFDSCWGRVCVLCRNGSSRRCRTATPGPSA